jgi:hypothetical protein
MSTELKDFKNHFIKNCDVKILGTIEEKHLPHWKRLCFDSLNCEEMLKVSLYIKNTFSNDGYYSHLLPKLQNYNNTLCLTVDVSQIKEKII